MTLNRELVYGRDLAWNTAAGTASMPGWTALAYAPGAARLSRTVEVVPKREYLFDGRSSLGGGPAEQEIVLASNIDTGDFGDGVLVVRVHDDSRANWTATARASVVVLTESYSDPEGQSVVVGTDALSTVTIDASTPSDSVEIRALTRRLTADRVRVVLRWAQGDDEATASQPLVIGVDLLLRRSGGIARTARQRPMRDTALTTTRAGVPGRLLARDRTSAGTLFEVIPKTTLTLSSSEDGREEIVLAQGIDAIDMQSVGLVVRLHEKGAWAANDSLVIAIHNESTDPCDPALVFVDPEPLASVTIDASAQNDELLLADTHDLTPIGGRLRVVLTWTQGADGSTESVTFAVDLLARAHPRAFRPTDVAACMLWLRSDLGVIVTEVGQVSAWGDNSGSGNHAVQTSASIRPSYEASGWSNGLPALNFERASIDKMDLPTGMSSASDDYTLFVALNQRSPTTYPQDILSTDGVGTAWLFAIVLQGNSQVGLYDGTWRGCGGAAVAGEQVLAWRLDSTSTTFECFRNGSSIGEAAWTGNVTWTNPVLGRLSMSQAIDARVAEVVLFSRKITDRELNQMNRYLAARYGV